MAALIWLKANWKIVAFVLYSVLLSYSAWAINNWRWEAKAYAAEQKAERERIDLAQSNAELIEKAENKEAKIIHDTKIVYKTITKLKPATCISGVPEFRTIWNGQITGQTSEPAD